MWIFGNDRNQDNFFYLGMLKYVLIHWNLSRLLLDNLSYLSINESSLTWKTKTF